MHINGFLILKKKIVLEEKVRSINSPSVAGCHFGDFVYDPKIIELSSKTRVKSQRVIIRVNKLLMIRVRRIWVNINY